MIRDEDSDYSLDEWANKRREFESSTLDLPSEAKFFELKPDQIRQIDIIPYRVGDKHPDRKAGSVANSFPYCSHTLQITEDAFTAVVCLAKCFAEPCPVCEELTRLKLSGVDYQIWKTLKPKYRSLWNVIDLEDRATGVQVWDVSDFLFGDPLRDAIKSDQQAPPQQRLAEYMAHPQKGCSLRLNVEKADYNPKQWKIKRVDFFPRKRPYKATIMQKAWCLDSFLKHPTYEEIQEILSQISGKSTNPNGDNMAERTHTTKKLGIVRGDKVNHQELGICKVLSISRDGLQITIEDSDGDVHKGVSPHEIFPVKKTAASKPVATTTSKKKKEPMKAQDEDEEIEFEDEDEEIEFEDEDEEDDDSEFEDEDAEDEDEEGDQDDEFEEDEEDEEDEDSEFDDEEDDSEFDDEEDEEDVASVKPARRGRPAKASAKPVAKPSNTAKAKPPLKRRDAS